MRKIVHIIFNIRVFILASISSKISYYCTRWLGARTRFTAIYRANVWSDDESVSGKGSRKDSSSVREALDALNFIAKKYSIKSISDIPCGDFNWIGEFLLQNPEITYHGFDIVRDLIKSNQAKHPDTKFSCLNIIKETPAASDLIFCKDLLNHLTNEEILKSVRNMVNSGSTYILATNNLNSENSELPKIRMATSRPVDLTARPFKFPSPEWCTNYMALWRVDTLQSFIGL